jgi:hypothetical protein
VSSKMRTYLAMTCGSNSPDASLSRCGVGRTSELSDSCRHSRVVRFTAGAHGYGACGGKRSAPHIDNLDRSHAKSLDQLTDSRASTRPLVPKNDTPLTPELIGTAGVWLVVFHRAHAAERRARRGLDKPETFNFLGITHICSRSRRGVFQLKPQTRRDRMRARLRAMKEELQRRLHEPISRKSMSSFRHYVTDLFSVL